MIACTNKPLIACSNIVITLNKKGQTQIGLWKIGASETVLEVDLDQVKKYLTITLNIFGFCRDKLKREGGITNGSVTTSGSAASLEGFLSACDGV